MVWMTCNVLPSATAWVEFTKNLIKDLRLSLLFSPKFDLKQAWGQKGFSPFSIRVQSLLKPF